MNDNHYFDNEWLIYQRIKALREEKKISRKAFADALGYKDESMISRLEAGKVDLTLDKLLRIKDILDVPLEYLIGLTSNAKGFIETKVPGMTALQVHALPDYVDSIDTNRFGIIANSYILVPSDRLYADVTKHVALTGGSVFNDFELTSRDVAIFANSASFSLGDILLVLIPSAKYSSKFEFICGKVILGTSCNSPKYKISIVSQFNNVSIDVVTHPIEIDIKDSHQASEKTFTCDNENIRLIGKLECVIKDYRYRYQLKNDPVKYWFE